MEYRTQNTEYNTEHIHNIQHNTTQHNTIQHTIHNTQQQHSA